MQFLWCLGNLAATLQTLRCMKCFIFISSISNNMPFPPCCIIKFIGNWYFSSVGVKIWHSEFSINYSNCDIYFCKIKLLPHTNSCLYKGDQNFTTQQISLHRPYSGRHWWCPVSLFNLPWHISTLFSHGCGGNYHQDTKEMYLLAHTAPKQINR